METSPEIKSLWEESIRLHGQCRYHDALDRMRRLEAHAPDNARLLANIGMVYRDNGDLLSAEQYLRKASVLLPDDPAIHFNLALTLMRAGRLQEGFDEYEWRWKVQQFAEQHRQFSQPLWCGEPLEGRRILIYGEQGAGDAIQFVRYAPLVREAAGDVMIEVLPHLERLMGWMDGRYPIVNALTKDVQFDLQCPMMSLPKRFGTELDSIPAPARFSIPADVQAKWTNRLRTGRKNMGVVWAGNPKHPNDRDRSLSAPSFLPLTRLAGIQYWSLQVGPPAADTPDGVVNLAEELTDFGETAAAISALDLVITVDTAVAHLAGSLGKPVWLLAAYTSDWRWLLDREDTPWYPSMKIFRQQRPGDWSDVIDRVVRLLRSGQTTKDDGLPHG
jgi:hypothetical protein